MSIVKRLKELLNASLNDMIDGLEDPRAMINQLIRDLDASILESRRQLTDALAQQQIVRHRLEKAKNDVGKWQEHAQLAVNNKRDDLAREALRRKQQAERDVEAIREQLSQSEQAVIDLRRQLELLAEKAQEARRKRDTLLSRQRPTPPATANQIITGFDSFAKLEEGIIRQRAATEPDVETACDTLKREASIDAELEKLKARQG